MRCAAWLATLGLFVGCAPPPSPAPAPPRVVNVEPVADPDPDPPEEVSLMEGFAERMYLDRLRRELHRNWQCPKGLGRPAIAEAEVRLAPDHRVRGFTLEPGKDATLNTAARLHLTSKVGEELPVPPHGVSPPPSIRVRYRCR